MLPHATPALITALDVPAMDDALALAAQVAPASPWVKVGLELFTASPPAIVPQLMQTGAQVFLDLKFFDIPATVRAAVAQAATLGAAMTTLHCLGGERMCAAAQEGREKGRRHNGGDAGPHHASKTLLIGVTLLTSMTGDDMAWLLPDAPGGEQELVLRMASRAKAWGLDGVVCSPKEVAAIKAQCGPDFVTVVPGVRPEGAGALAAPATDDQRRTATPAQAVRDGADYLVVGRPIRTASDPAAAASAIVASMRL